jgi:exodeoxyribonuclease VIII
MRPPIVPDLPIEDYHSPDCEYVSSTFLRTLQAKSPAHAMAEKKAEKKPKKCFEIGTLIHTLILEPETFESRYGVFDGDFRTKEAKELKADFESRNITVIKTADYENALACAEAMKNFHFYDMIFGSGEPEVSLFAEIDGVKLKARPDWLQESTGRMFDLKTTTDASPEAFTKSVGNYGYHIQACLAMRIHEATFGEPCDDYLWLVIEKDPPYAITLNKMSPEMRLNGELKLNLALEKYQKCLKTGIFEAYSPSIKVLELNPWNL